MNEYNTLVGSNNELYKQCNTFICTSNQLKELIQQHKGDMHDILLLCHHFKETMLLRTDRITEHLQKHQNQKNKLTKAFKDKINNIETQAEGANEAIIDFNKKSRMTQLEIEDYNQTSTKIQKTMLQLALLAELEQEHRNNISQVQSLRQKHDRTAQNIKACTLKTYRINGCDISFRKSESIYMNSDAIVIPTNDRMKDFPSTSKHIIQNAGRQLIDQIAVYKRDHGRLPVGNAKLFHSGKLSTQYAILTSIPTLNDLNTDIENVSLLTENALID